MKHALVKTFVVAFYRNHIQTTTKEFCCKLNSITLCSGGSNTGDRSFTFFIQILTDADPVFAGVPLSVAVTWNSYFLPCMKS